MLVISMKERTLDALQTVYDTILSYQDYTELPFAAKLIQNIESARMRLMQHLEYRKKVKESTKIKKHT